MDLQGQDRIGHCGPNELRQKEKKVSYPDPRYAPINDTQFGRPMYVLEFEQSSPIDRFSFVNMRGSFDFRVTQGVVQPFTYVRRRKL
jgi:hypothetical protein